MHYREAPEGTRAKSCAAGEGIGPGTDRQNHTDSGHRRQFMSLIHTAEMCSENPFEYLIALQKNADAVAANPAARVPWKFRKALASQTAH